MICWTDDPVRDAENYWAEKYEELEKLPECGMCGEHIQEEHCYEIDDKLICEDCLRVLHRWREEGDGLRCGVCGELITDADYHEIEGKPTCDNCVRVFQRRTEDYT